MSSPDSTDEKEVFHQALCLSDSSQRSAYLDGTCQGNAALRQRVDSLLHAAEDDDSFMRKQAIELVDSKGDDAHTNNAARETPPARSDDASIDAHSNLLAGQALGHYKVISLIGSGGMGKVYLAEDQRLRRNVALKVIAAGQFDEQRLRILREAQLASALDHPNVCAVHDIGESDSQCFIAMQHVEGQTLEQVVGGRPLPTDKILSIALQIADALSAAHQRGIIHRDIKPRNILINAHGLVKVLDFGLARLLAGDNPSASRPDGAVGTPAYMSPEQVRGEVIDHRSDIFSFGAVLYQITTGLAPFRGRSSLEVMQAVIADTPAAPRELNPRAPTRLAEVIDRALAKSREDRYQSVEEIQSDLNSIAAKVSLPANPAFINLRRRNRAALAAIVIISLAIAGGWFAWRASMRNWAAQQLPTVMELAKAGQTFAAFDLAVRVREYRPDEPKLSKLMAAISTTLNVTSEPARAEVWLKRFDPDAAVESATWTFVGTTPLSGFEVARGDYLVSVEHEGYEPFQRSWSDLVAGAVDAPINAFEPVPINVTLMTLEQAKERAGMMFVPGGEYRLGHWRRPTDVKAKLQGFFIDKFEVTNREYKKFVDDGGYQNARFWPADFVKEDRKISRDEALRELVDRTGRPGPRDWSRATYPEGKANHPVAGVTWYEAAAYAAYRGKSLPTIFQWEKAAKYAVSNNFLGVTMPWGLFHRTIDGRANLSTNGTVPVGKYEFGMSPFGCFEMAGNVAEWCLNQTSNGFITSGGSWASLPQSWGEYGAYPGFHRSHEIGFRCVWNPPGAGGQGAIAVTIDGEPPVFEPALEAEVRGWMKDHYHYDSTLTLEEEVDTAETSQWRRKRIEYNGAQGQRAIAYLYLPKGFPGPHQVIHLFPAGDVRQGFRTVPQTIETDYIHYLRSGRAVFAVVLQGFLERESPAKWIDATQIEYVEDNARDVIDMRRGLDYLLSRPDIDRRGVAFMGCSFGGPWMVLPAIESRYRAVILSAAAVKKTSENAAANAEHFIPLIRPPKLQVHGRFDEVARLKTQAEPLHHLLSGSDKKMHLYDGGHRPDPKEQSLVVNAWLDEVIGKPVPPGPSQE
jgi:formylglycine-generating enzyme required for sulfatase activity